MPPGVYFRMLIVGFFEGIESERGICWRCSDSLSLRSFLGLSLTDRVPDHSSLSRIRTRLPQDVFEFVFELVLGIVEDAGLLRGRVAGVDSTYLRADASMRSIVRRDTREDYAAFVKRLASEDAGCEVTAEEARAFDKQRSKRTSNREWVSSVDADARIARLKDGRTRLAYKAEHVTDLETGVLLTARVLSADAGDGETLVGSVSDATERVARVRVADADASDDPAAAASSDDDDPPGGGAGSSNGAAGVRVVGDKGYHKATAIRDLKEAGFRSVIPERKVRGQRRWADKGGRATAVAVYQNRARVQRSLGRSWLRKRGEFVERSFAHLCDTGGTRRSRLRGQANVQKRYWIAAAALNLGAIMRHRFGSGTPRGWADENADPASAHAPGTRSPTPPAPQRPWWRLTQAITTWWHAQSRVIHNPHGIA